MGDCSHKLNYALEASGIFVFSLPLLFSWLNMYEYLYKQSRYKILTLSMFYLFVDCMLITRIIQMGLLTKNDYDGENVLLVGDLSLVFDFLIGVTHTENLCCCIVALRDLRDPAKTSTTLRKVFYVCQGLWILWAIA